MPIIYFIVWIGVGALFAGGLGAFIGLAVAFLTVDKIFY